MGHFLAVSRWGSSSKSWMPTRTHRARLFHLDSSSNELGWNIHGISMVSRLFWLMLKPDLMLWSIFEKHVSQPPTPLDRSKIKVVARNQSGYILDWFNYKIKLNSCRKPWNFVPPKWLFFLRGGVFYWPPGWHLAVCRDEKDAVPSRPNSNGAAVCSMGQCEPGIFANVPVHQEGVTGTGPVLTISNLSLVNMCV